MRLFDYILCGALITLYVMAWPRRKNETFDREDVDFLQSIGITF